MDKKAFKKYGYQIVDWIADYLNEVENYPVIPVHNKPDYIKNQLPAQAPVKGECMDLILKDFHNIIFPGITHWQHPSWFAYFSANNSPPSILAEFLTAGLGVQCMVWQTSPSATELEEVVMEWLRDLLSLPEEMKGVIQDTASTSTLCALLTAREKATSFSSNQDGIQKPLIIYASMEAHSSIEKAVKIAGFGKKYFRRIKTDETFALIPEELEKSVISDIEKGFIPCAVVGTSGTTSSSALDPLEEIGKICQKYNLWFHIDAAYAGTAAILPEKKWILKGTHLADSFVFNPHKWMLTNFDCSAYFVKDPSILVRTFEIYPEYLKTKVDLKVNNYKDWGIQLGRRFRALKLWFVLRYYGHEGLQQIIREHIRLAEMFKNFVIKEKYFELMAPVPLSLVCFRLNDGRKSEELNKLNLRFLTLLNDTKKIHLSHTVLNGKYVLRMAIGTRTTTKKHVLDAWNLMIEISHKLLKKKEEE